MNERIQSDDLDKVLGDVLKAPVSTGEALIIPPMPKLEVYPHLFAALTDEPNEAEELAAQVAQVTTNALAALRQNRPFELDLDDPINVALLMSMGPAAIGSIVLPNADGSETGMYAATLAETSAENASIHFTWLGTNTGTRWEVPPQLDPTKPGQSGNDVLVYLSFATQGSAQGQHGNSPVPVLDPRHMWNQFMKARQGQISPHLADQLDNPLLIQNKGKRRLLEVTSASKIVLPGEFGPGLLQDPIRQSRKYGFEELGFKWTFIPWMMDQNALHSGVGQLNTLRANLPDAQARAQRMGFASLIQQGAAEAFTNNLKQTGGMV